MPSVKCTLKSCAYRNRRGYCTRKSIVLQANREGFNELYCLGWSTPETKLFVDMCNERSDALPETMKSSNEELQEQIAKWLFKNKNRLPERRFYANWYDETSASPLTEKEYLNLANELITILTSSKEEGVTR